MLEVGCVLLLQIKRALLPDSERNSVAVISDDGNPLDLYCATSRVSHVNGPQVDLRPFGDWTVYLPLVVGMQAVGSTKDSIL